MGFLKRQPRPEHNPGVIYVFEKKVAGQGAYGAVCRCGWSAGLVQVQYPDAATEERMAAAALAHSPDADVTVAFPMDRPR
jgi:hypothetical protein